MGKGKGNLKILKYFQYLLSCARLYFFCLFVLVIVVVKGSDFVEGHFQCYFYAASLVCI